MYCLNLPAQFRRHSIAAAASTLFLFPELSSAAVGPGPLGGEFQVNTKIKDNQGYASVAADADGDFVVAWTSGNVGRYDIRAQRYNAAGAPQGAEFLVSADTRGASQILPAVALDADGDFVVTWVSYGRSYQILARRYNALGVAKGDPFQVNLATPTLTFDYAPRVALDADGDCVVTWLSASADAPYSLDYNVVARRYNAEGIEQGAPFQVNSETGGDQAWPTVATDADGDFVIAWMDDSASSNSYDIRARRYSAAGAAEGNEFQVNTVTEDDQSRPVVAMDAGGDFVVAWDSRSSGDVTIAARRYNAVGVAQGAEFQVNTLIDIDATGPAVATDASGDFVVSWTSGNFGGTGTGYDIRARGYNAAGAALGDDFPVNTVTTGEQRFPAIAADADGDFVIAWNSSTGGSSEIQAQRYQGPDAVDLSLFQTDSADPVTVGSPLSYTLNVSNLRAPSTVTGVPAIDSAIGTAAGISLVDRLPKGGSNLSISGSNWSCTGAAAKLSCNYLLPLAAGTTASPLQLSLTPPNKTGRTIENAASVSADPFDDRPDNNSDIERTLLQ